MEGILKESDIFKVKEAVANKEITHNDGKMRLQEINQKYNQLIKCVMSLFESLFVHDGYSKWKTFIQYDFKPKCRMMAENIFWTENPWAHLESLP